MNMLQYPALVTLHPRTGQFVIDNLPLLLLCLSGYIGAGIEGLLFSGWLLWLSVFLSIVLLYRFIDLKRKVYKIDEEQLVYEHGVFVRHNEYIELYRIVDFREQQSLLQQLAGLKTVSVYSGDRTTPRLDIIGTDHREQLVTLIRERVELNKRRKGIYEITNR